MPSEGYIARLGDLIEVNHGWPFKSDFFSEQLTGKGIVVAIGNFRYSGGFRFLETTIKEYRGDYPSEYELTPGDILLVMTCQTAGGEILGIPARVPKDGRLYLHNQRIGKVVVKSGAILADFLYWLFLSHDFNRALVATASGTKILHTSPSRICDYRFELPPIEAQHKAAGLLHAIQDRIDLLRQTNATLESIAQALFKSWFIDFDPVRAKAEGREPEGMDAATAALFPSTFEESDLGLIPKGWRAGTLAALCSRVVNGGTPSRRIPDFWNCGHMAWFKTGELMDGFLTIPSERISESAIAETSVKVLPRHSVLMAIYAAPTVGRLGILTEDAAFNQACTGMVARDDVGPWFLFQTLKHGRDWFNSRANGAAQQNISKAIVETYRCVEPASGALALFRRLAGALYDAIESNTLTSRSLVEVRDTLLPRLISGKLRIPEAQAQVEDAMTFVGNHAA